ncbi:Sir2 family NAD-dependent protein deacetylase [Microbacterium sp.]|uniref:Sir2 family NAD-dependent protein deacetylase n=1 Tax=Microbacterium sp. TaxID=51671 RepID=UPI003A944742
MTTTIDDAVRVLEGRRIAVLTGAGVSTDSGIPDYRGEGAPVRTPMTVQKFLAGDAARRRYWMGSHLGWLRLSSAEPNAGHRALATLERAGVTNGVTTQNVDGLHLQAGSERIVELHGTVHRAVCLHCGQVFDRRDLAARIDADNPWLVASPDAVLLPDGDVRPDSIDGFTLPVCTVCGGMLKPEVVFFGEVVPVAIFTAAERLLTTADALLVAGSSLVVNSGMRLVQRAERRGLPIVVVNRGQTRADARATVKLDAGTSEVLVELAARLRGP